MKTYSITTGGLCLFSLEHAHSSSSSTGKLQGYWGDLQLFLQAGQLLPTAQAPRRSAKRGTYRAASIAAWELRAKVTTAQKRAEHA